MAKEIERKFLVNQIWKPKGMKLKIVQGYLSCDPERIVRVRTIEQGHLSLLREAYLTIKGKTVGIERAEYEYTIPFDDANEMLKLCGINIINKTRYYDDDHTRFSIDVFHGQLEGLILAEIELASENEYFVTPEWLGDEVSHDARYYNSNLLKGMPT